MENKAPILLSTVVPYRNYDRRTAEMVQAIADVVAPLVDDYEIIIVDNGSTDEQFDDYSRLLGTDGVCNLQIYRLIQTVDNDTAAWAGVENSLGDFVLVHDPRSENLSRLADALRAIAEGREVVYLRNVGSTDRGMVESLLGPAFRWAFRRLTGINLALDATPGRLISKRVVSYLLQQPRPDIRFRALPSVAGFSKTTLTYSAPRHPDPTRGFWARARAAIRLVVSNSMAPLRIVSGTALLGAALNLLYSVYVVMVSLLKRNVAPGWTTLSLQQSGMFFLISVAIVVLTEYWIQTIRSASTGPSYFLASEATSAVLTRRQRLNVERVGGAAADGSGSS